LRSLSSAASVESAGFVEFIAFAGFAESVVFVVSIDFIGSARFIAFLDLGKTASAPALSNEIYLGHPHICETEHGGGKNRV
jgi:hypothetical protein